MRGRPDFLSTVASALSPSDLWSGPPEQAYYLHHALIREMSLGLSLVKTRNDDLMFSTILVSECPTGASCFLQTFP